MTQLTTLSRRLFVLALVILFSQHYRAQVIVSESFDGATFAPAGWTNSAVVGASVWDRQTTGTFPTIANHSGAGMARWNSFNIGTNNSANLVTPVIDWSTRGANTPSLSIWWVRDVSNYNTTTYDNEGITIWVNTSPNTAGATQIGFLPRRGGQAATGMTSGPATTAATGWQNYTYDIPAAYNGTTNYIIFQALSKFGDNCFLDDVSWVAYPSATTPTITGFAPSPVCAGGTVTITGTNFTGATAVTVNGLAVASYIVNSATQITATLSATNSSGFIAVTTPSGTATSGTQLTVNPIPSVASVTATPASVCSGGNSQLQVVAGTTSSYLVSSIPFAAIATPGSGVTTLCNATVQVTPLSAGTLDDGSWNNQSIPFGFNFFGTTYTSFAVSTNGFITLGTGAPNNYNGYGNALPSTFAGFPCIGPLYSDLDFRTAGTVNYFTSGSTPNRKFVINFSGGQFYLGTGSLTTQIILYETSNVIEVHTTNSTGNNSAVEGIQNATGTVAFTVAGRNAVTWPVATPDAYRWSPNGGAPTYAWAPPTFLNNTTISNPLASGVTATTTYTVNVTAGGCSTSGSVTVTAGAVLSSSGNITPSNTVCAGTSVTLNVTPAGGGAPYSYSWLGPNSFNSTAQNPTISNLTTAASGTYTVTVTDNCTSTSVTQVTLTVNPLPAVAVSPTSAVLCPGSPGIALTASGGNTYTWSPATGLNTTSGANVTATPTANITYTVTGTALNGCTATASAGVSVPPDFTTSVTASPSSICSGSNSQLLATANSTTYALSNPSFSQQPCQANAGPVGDDIVQGPNAIGFTFNYYGVNYTQFGISTNGNIQIGDGSGSANNPLYNNTWVDVPIPNAALPNNMVALAWDDWLANAGNITWGVTGSAPNRQLIVCFNMTGRGSGSPDTLNGQIVLEETTNKIYLNLVKKGIQPLNTVTQGIEDQTGSAASVGVPGRQNTAWSVNNDTRVFASGPFTYAWSPATFLTATNIANPVANAATATTTYTVNVSDQNGCSHQGSVTLTVNPLPVVTASASASPVCSGNPSTLTSSGATTYSWQPGNLNGSPVVVTPSSTTTYTVTGTDGNGCSATANTTVTVNPTPTVTVAGNNSICAGGNTTLTASGATSFNWQPGNINGASINVSPTSTTTYTVTGSEPSGCFSTQMITVTVNPLPTISISGNTTICSGQNTALTASGASTYSWSSGGNAATEFVSPASTTTYTVTGTDGNNCSSSASVTVDVNPTPTVTITGNTSICAGDNTILTASGADSYFWTPGNFGGDIVSVSPSSTTTYTVNASSLNGCNTVANVTVTVNPLPTISISGNTTICDGSSTTLTASGASTYSWSSGGNAANETVSPSSTTSYTVTGTSAAACSGTATVSVTVNPTPTVTVAGNTTICNGSSTTLTASGASTYTWSSGGSAANETVSPASTTTYTVTGTGANSCTNSATVTVTVNPTPTVTIAGNTTICNGSSTTLTASGASTYSWSSGGNAANETVTPSSTTTYTVTGTGANSCTSTATVSVTVNPLPTISVTGNTTICNGSSTTLTASGASTYSWSSGGNAANETVSPNTTSTYTVTGTDANSCSNTSTVSVTVNPLPVISVSGTTTICDGNSTMLTASGASTYTWSSGGNSANETVSPNTTSSYTVAGTDANSCVGTTTVTVTVNPLPVISISGNTTICDGSSTTLTASGASTYTWSSGGNAANETVSPNSQTSYTVTGTDVNGCSDLATTTVNVNPAPVVDLGPDVAQCSGTVTLDAGNPGETYLWNDNSTSQTLVASTSGIYWVDVTNGSGCTTRDSVTVTINSNPVVNLGPDATVCGSILLDAGNPGASYAWSEGSTTQTITVTTSGTYSVLVTLAGGCTASDAIDVTVNPLPVVTLNFPMDTVCFNGGSIALSGESPSGGTWSGPGVTGNSFDPGTSGLGQQPITYTFTDANGCSASAMENMFVDICSGTNTSVSNGTITLYPNPNNGAFSVNFLPGEKENVLIEIFSPEGKLMSSQSVYIDNYATLPFDISNYASGMYFMKVTENNGKTHVIKIDLQR